MLKGNRDYGTTINETGRYLLHYCWSSCFSFKILLVPLCSISRWFEWIIHISRHNKKGFYTVLVEQFILDPRGEKKGKEEEKERKEKKRARKKEKEKRDDPRCRERLSFSRWWIHWPRGLPLRCFQTIRHLGRFSLFGFISHPTFFHITLVWWV